MYNMYSYKKKLLLLSHLSTNLMESRICKKKEMLANSVKFSIKYNIAFFRNCKRESDIETMVRDK